MKKTPKRRTNTAFHESVMRRIATQLLVWLLIALSYLPFWVLYRISDIMYFLIRHVVKYRFNIISTNLKHSFPEKTEIEIAGIRNRFYRHFCDMFFESIKMYSISDKEMAKRVTIVGIQVSESYFKEGKSIIALAMHYNNWEWTSYVQSVLSHVILVVFNPVRGNQAMERFLTHNREKWGAKCAPVDRIARTILEYNIKGIKTGVWLAADQTPPASSKFWTMFLNQETPFFQGPEKIAVTTNQPVLFQHTKKVGRGKYVIEYSLLFDNPKEVEQKNILLAYIRKCEEIIQAEPEYYLWSHRRWKHKRPEGIELTE